MFFSKYLEFYVAFRNVKKISQKLFSFLDNCIELLAGNSPIMARKPFIGSQCANKQSYYVKSE